MTRIRVIIVALIGVLVFSGLLYAQTTSPRVRRVIPRDRGRDRVEYRTYISQLSAELVRQAEELSLTSYDYFMGWNGEITRQEQAVLFKSEEFTASCRLFQKLVSEQSNYYRSDSLRTNLYTAHQYLADSFQQLESKMHQSGFREGFSRSRRDGRSYDGRIRPGMSTGQWGLMECRRLIEEIESEFTSWRR